MADRTGLGRRLAKVRASVKANAYVPLFKYEDALLENKVNYDRADVLERERDTLRAEVAALRKSLKEFGSHNPGCAWTEGYDPIEGLAWNKCDCGLDAALADKPLSGPTP